MVKDKENKTDFRIAVKAFIVHNNKLLIVKRAKDDIQKPNIWELPGGRLEIGEDPFVGLVREVREETGFYITPILPMSINHFERDDGQIITMIISLCKPVGGRLNISKEHQDIAWVNINQAKEKLSDFFHKDVDIFYKLKLDDF
ncbi:MAG: NUDIX domain-containing protein [Candidatus Pacearchaeota archaeon]|jgi:8-oxo-dGTP diphosphatase